MHNAGFLLGSGEDIRRGCRISNAGPTMHRIQAGSGALSASDTPIETNTALTAGCHFFNLTSLFFFFLFFDPPRTRCPDSYEKRSLAAFSSTDSLFHLLNKVCQKAPCLQSTAAHGCPAHTHRQHPSPLPLSLATSERQSPESISSYLPLGDEPFSLSLGKSPSARCGSDQDIFVANFL